MLPGSAAAQTVPAAAVQAPAQAQAAAQAATQAAAQAAALVHQAALVLAPPGARVEVEAGALDPRLRLSPCTRIEPYLPASGRVWGAARVGLRCLEGATPWNVSLPMTVKVYAAAPVALGPLPAGTVLTAEHLGRAEVDWAAEPSAVQTDRDALLGRTLAKALPAGQPVRSAHLRTRQWFAVGDTVRIVAQGSGFSVTGEGQALSPGLEGQTARVRTESGRIVSGMPRGERRLELAL